MGVLDNFVQALQNNDQVVIKDMLSQLDDAIQTMSIRLPSVVTEKYHQTQDIIDDLRVQYETQRSEVQDVDMARALVT